jgi:hypothetical protein
VSLVATANALLRTRSPERLIASLPARQLVILLLIAGFAYGAVMGCFNLRPLQVLFSALKVPILLTASSLVCLPSFFVINTLLGLRDDFPIVFRALINMQLTMAMVLASLAPFTALAYVSTGDYHFAIVFNGIMFLTASLASHIQLSCVYEPLIQRHARHRTGRRIWLTLYIFVTIQLAWMLRPFVGTPELPPTFFRPGVWDNAYVVVFKDVWTLFTK